MICPNCGKEVSRTSIRYIDEKRVETCKHCETHVSYYPIYDSTNGYTISVAHRKDIQSRKVDINTGEVTRR